MQNQYDRWFTVSGQAKGEHALVSFDAALLKAGVGDLNIIKMSSILPPGCKQTKLTETSIPKGALVPMAYASVTSKRILTPRFVFAGVAVGIPEDPEEAGLIMELHKDIDLYIDSKELYEIEHEFETHLLEMVEEGMHNRNRPIKDIVKKIISLDYYDVHNYITLFAAVVLTNH